MVKIIEAKAIITSGFNGKGFDDALKKMESLGKANKSFSSAGAKDFGVFAKKIDELNAKAGSIDGFRAQHAALIAARQQFRAAEADVQRLGKAMSEAAKPSRELTREYERSQRSVKQASAAWQDQVASVKAAKAAMESHGVTLRNLRAQQGETNRFRRGVYEGSGPLAHVPPHGSPQAPPSSGGVMMVPGGIKSAGALALAYGASRAHGAVVDKHHDYQQAYLYQQAVLSMNAEQQAPMLNQAIKIGQDTKFTNADIVKAQTDIGSKLSKEQQNPATIMGITESTKNYALAMRVSMEEASVAMVGWMKSRGYDLSSPAAAEKSARRAANQMVEFAKTTGAKHHDLIGDTKFGAAPGMAGGFSEEYANALSAQLIRIGYEGAMAGTFVRAAAMKLSAPTMKGQAAIAAAGLNFDDYVKPGTNVGVGGLGKMIQQRFGRGLSGDQNTKLQEVFDNPETMGDKGSFVEAVSGILNSTFARKTKGGKVNAQDAERIAKTINEFHTLSAQGVDSERLMTDLVKKGMPPALAKYLFGSEQGGRAIALNADQLGRDVKNFQNVPENRAAGVASKMQEGAQGEYTKMTGSFETFTVAVGEATDGLRSLTYQGIAGLFDALTRVVQGKADFGKRTDQIKTLEAEIASVSRRMNDAGLTPGQRSGLGQQLNKLQGRHMLASDGVPVIDGSKITARVETPIDVTGKVALDPASKVDVSVSVKVQGPATVTGQNVTAGGNARGSVGTSTEGGGAP